eukprot:COSAG02_NODE_133_length_34692_cov_83.845229_18_plen_50_part_00
MLLAGVGGTRHGGVGSGVVRTVCARRMHFVRVGEDRPLAVVVLACLSVI